MDGERLEEKVLDLDDLTVLRRKLKFRSWHRGTREMDLVMGRFADAHLDRMDGAALADYALLLECPDPDLYNWITGRAPVPEADDTPVLRALCDSYRGAADRDGA